MKTSLTGRLHTLHFFIHFAFPAFEKWAERLGRKKKINISDFLVCSIALYFHLLFVLWRALKASQNTAQHIKIFKYVTAR